LETEHGLDLILHPIEVNTNSRRAIIQKSERTTYFSIDDILQEYESQVMLNLIRKQSWYPFKLSLRLITSVLNLIEEILSLKLSIILVLVSLSDLSLWLII
jgi:hypothetical protein